MIEKPLSGLMMVIPGTTFIALGVLIVARRSVVPWLVAVACILAGGAMFLKANSWGGVGARLRRAGG